MTGSQRNYYMEAFSRQEGNWTSECEQVEGDRRELDQAVGGGVMDARKSLSQKENKSLKEGAGTGPP